MNPRKEAASAHIERRELLEELRALRAQVETLSHALHARQRER